MGKVTKPKGSIIPETTGGRIEYVRRTSLVSQKELADRLGVKREYLSMIETGDRNPKIDMLKTISEMFNVTCDFLLCCSDVSAPYESMQAASKRLGLGEKAQEKLEAMQTFVVENAALYEDAPDDDFDPGDINWDEVEIIEVDRKAEDKYFEYKYILSAINTLLITEHGLNILKLMDTLFSMHPGDKDEKNTAFAEIIDLLSQLRHSYDERECWDNGGD